MYFVVSDFEKAPFNIRGRLYDAGFDFDWDPGMAHGHVKDLRLPMVIQSRPGTADAGRDSVAAVTSSSSQELAPETVETHAPFRISKREIRELEATARATFGSEARIAAVGAMEHEELADLPEAARLGARVLTPRVGPSLSLVASPSRKESGGILVLNESLRRALAQPGWWSSVTRASSSNPGFRQLKQRPFCPQWTISYRSPSHAMLCGLAFTCKWQLLLRSRTWSA